MDNVIEVEGLRKRYGSYEALKGIGFTVERGEVYTIVGPNGAGKTTTVEILEGIRSSDSGSIRILGDRVGSDTVKRKIGVQLQESRLLDNLKPIETVELFRSFYETGLKPEEALDIVSLGPKRNTLVKNLSGGERQRLGIALAIVNDPDIIFLDEPTTGLDPGVRRELWDIIESFRERNKTVVLTTHYMDEAEKLSSRVAILNAGEIIACDTPENLVKNSAIASRITFTIDAPPGFGEKLALFAPRMTESKGEFDILVSEVEDTLPRLFSLARSFDKTLTDIFVRHPSLDDVFLALTGSKFEEDAK